MPTRGQLHDHKSRRYTSAEGRGKNPYFGAVVGRLLESCSVHYSVEFPKKFFWRLLIGWPTELLRASSNLMEKNISWPRFWQHFSQISLLASVSLVYSPLEWHRVSAWKRFKSSANFYENNSRTMDQMLFMEALSDLTRFLYATWTLKFSFSLFWWCWLLCFRIVIVEVGADN